MGRGERDRTPYGIALPLIGLLTDEWRLLDGWALGRGLDFEALPLERVLNVVTFRQVRSADENERDELAAMLNARPAPPEVRQADPDAPWWWAGEEAAAAEAGAAMVAMRGLT